MGQLNWSFGKQIAMWSVVAMVVLTQASMLVCSWYPFEPLRIDEIRITSPIEPGKPFEYVIIGEKLMDKPGRVSRQFINHIVVTMPPIISHVEKGTKMIRPASFDLPALPEGEYCYKVSVTYQFPFGRTVTVAKKTGPIYIPKATS